MAMIEIDNLNKCFGEKKVIKGLNMVVPENTVFGFVGQNGAGKTTTMKMILGLMKPDSGTIRVNGENVLYGDTPTNRFIGYLPDVPEYYSFMTTREYLRFCGEIAGLSKDELDARIEDLLRMVGLSEEKRRIKGFSRGMKQRLGIAQALIHKPKLLICDEPTSALDPIGRKEVLDVLVSVKKETTVIFSTHILSDVEKICDEVAFLKDGNIALSGSIEEIRHAHKEHCYTINLDNSSDTDKLIANDSSIERVDDYTVKVKVNESSDINKTIKFMMDEGITFSGVNRMEPSLEDMFLEVAG